MGSYLTGPVDQADFRLTRCLTLPVEKEMDNIAALEVTRGLIVADEPAVCRQRNINHVRQAGC